MNPNQLLPIIKNPERVAAEQLATSNFATSGSNIEDLRNRIHPPSRHIFRHPYFALALLPMLFSAGCSDESTQSKSNPAGQAPATQPSTVDKESLSGKTFERLFSNSSTITIIDTDEDPIYEWILAEHYRQGNSVTPNVQKAINLLNKASDAGHVGATATLADMYSAGKGVMEDHEKAFFYNSRAAKYGFPSGLFNLGSSYLRGDGCEKDITEGAFWIETAALRGHALAIKVRQKMFPLLTDEQGEEVRERAINWNPESIIPRSYVDRFDELDTNRKTASSAFEAMKLGSEGYGRAKGKVLYYDSEITALETELYLHFGIESDARRAWREGSNRWLMELESVADRSQAISAIRSVNTQANEVKEKWGHFPLDVSRFTELGTSLPVGSLPFSRVAQQIIELKDRYRVSREEVEAPAPRPTAFKNLSPIEIAELSYQADMEELVARQAKIARDIKVAQETARIVKELDAWVRGHLN